MGPPGFRQGVPLSELVYALILVKYHLRRYVRTHGLVEFSGDPAVAGEFLPIHLHGIQEFNYMVDEFLGRAPYLAFGYEGEARLAHHAVRWRNASASPVRWVHRSI